MKTPASFLASLLGLQAAMASTLPRLDSNSDVETDTARNSASSALTGNDDSNIHPVEVAPFAAKPAADADAATATAAVDDEQSAVRTPPEGVTTTTTSGHDEEEATNVSAIAADDEKSAVRTPPEGVTTKTTSGHDEEAATNVSAIADDTSTDVGAPDEFTHDTSCTATVEDCTPATASDEAGDTEKTVQTGGAHDTAPENVAISEGRKLESVLQLSKKHAFDPKYQVVLEDTSMTLHAVIKAKDGAMGKVEMVIPLTRASRVHEVSDKSFAIKTHKGDWTFAARDQTVRDLWVTSLTTTILKSPESKSDVLDFEASFGFMVPRRVTMGDSAMTMCKMNRDGSSKFCEDLVFGPSSDVTVVEDKKKKGRHLFRVISHHAQDPRYWTFDAGSADNLEEWMHLLQFAIRGARDTVSPAEAEMDEASVIFGRTTTYRFRENTAIKSRSTLGPRDKPLTPKELLSSSPDGKTPSSLEITSIGDVLLRSGLTLNPEGEPIWAHRTTSSYLGKSNGGLGCVVQALWRRLEGEEDVKMGLSVKNGRWRVGRGRLCTLASSPAPEGSWRRFIPFDARGEAVRTASLVVKEDGRFTVSAGEDVMWDSSLA